MKHHRRIIRRLRTLALGLAAIASLAPAVAVAQPAHDTGAWTHEEATGATATDREYSAYSEAMAALSPEELAAAFGTDWLHATASPTTVGDTPGDTPDASRAPQDVAVARPERIVTRDVHEELPVALAASALLISLGNAGYTLMRTRSLSRGRLGRPH